MLSLLRWKLLSLGSTLGQNFILTFQISNNHLVAKFTDYVAACNAAKTTKSKNFSDYWNKLWALSLNHEINFIVFSWAQVYSGNFCQVEIYLLFVYENLISDQFPCLFYNFWNWIKFFTSTSRYFSCEFRSKLWNQSKV